MKSKLKLIFNVYTIPAILLTLLNILVLFGDIESITWVVIVFNITFWITGILLYKKKNFASIISIIPIIISFYISMQYENHMIDPYLIHGILFFYFIICDLVVLYKNNEIKKLTKKITTIFIITILILSITFCIVDNIRIKNEKMPIFMILVNASYDNEYIGLGYRFQLNNGLAPSAGILPNSEYKFGSWFFWIITKDNSEQSDYIIENE